MHPHGTGLAGWAAWWPQSLDTASVPWSFAPVRVRCPQQAAPLTVSPQGLHQGTAAGTSPSPKRLVSVLATVLKAPKGLGAPMQGAQSISALQVPQAS